MNFYSSIKSHGKTDIGLFRENNEDGYLIVDPGNEAYDVSHRGLLFAVADGMGGHAAGEVASKMACEGLLQYYEPNIDQETESSDPVFKLKRLRRVIHKTNEEIYRYAQTHPEFSGMGTTLSVLILSPENAIIGHVGDSRIYRFRNRKLKLLTVDHTEVQAMIDSGRLTPDEAAVHPFRHALLQAVGTMAELETIDTGIESVQPGDIYLLSTDGLHDSISDEDIERTLRENRDIHIASDRLIDLSLKKGGRDNITLIIAAIPL
ncbi:MAG TPA: serine/threonine-protein phosphatase [Deltaproteobacteria bacterium]|nr:serine/threonine-protein phosphatase [Deltaproteobacteria bacterium]